jgi:hypothetical protein
VRLRIRVTTCFPTMANKVYLKLYEEYESNLDAKSNLKLYEKFESNLDAKSTLL